MDKLLPYYYRSYGMYVNHFRSFPLDIDGCKPVERRVLLSTYDIAKGDKTVKSARVDGHCIGHYHPHGSSYGTIVSLVNQGFLDGQGNFGSRIGVEPVGPAAMRYTECRLSKKTKEDAFELIDYVPWIESELDQEPQYLPTMFPFCLMGKEYTVGIGFGYKTYIPCYTQEDLHQRLLWLLKIRKRKPIIKPITDCEILATNETLEELLTTGKAKVEVKGKYEKDDNNFKVMLSSWAPGSKFESILRKLGTELDAGDIAYSDLSSNGETRIYFEVIKQRNRPKIYENLIEKLDSAITGNISFEIVVVDLDRNVKTIGVDEMLLKTHSMYTEATKNMLESKISELVIVKEEYEVLEKIRPFLKDYIANDNIEIVVTALVEKTKVNEAILRGILNKYRIKRLFTIRADISEVQEEIDALQTKLGRLSEYVLSTYAGTRNGSS